MRLHEHVLETGLTVHGSVYVTPYVSDEKTGSAVRCRRTWYQDTMWSANTFGMWHLLRITHELTSVIVQHGEVSEDLLLPHRQNGLLRRNAVCFVDDEAFGVFGTFDEGTLFFPFVMPNRLYGWREMLNTLTIMQRLVLDVLRDDVPELHVGA